MLEIFGIAHLFKTIIESAVVGVRKPDPKIYQLGADFLELDPMDCVVIGDSFIKDIVPAKQLGCRAIWLNVTGWEEAKTASDGQWMADAEITEFASVTNEMKKLK